MTTLRDFLDNAKGVAWEAGSLTTGHVQTGLQLEHKTGDTPVTGANRAAERLNRDRITRRLPLHAAVGEQHGVTESNGAPHH